MAGKFLAFPGFGKEAIHIVAVSGRERVFDAPDFLKQRIGVLCIAVRFHGSLAASRLAAIGGQLHERMAGFQFAFARFGKQRVKVVAVFGGKSVLRAPHFAEGQAASRLCGRACDVDAQGRNLRPPLMEGSKNFRIRLWPVQPLGSSV